jgi:hypothetical protein
MIDLRRISALYLGLVLTATVALFTLAPAQNTSSLHGVAVTLTFGSALGVFFTQLRRARVRNDHNG